MSGIALLTSFMAHLLVQALTLWSPANFNISGMVVVGDPIADPPKLTLPVGSVGDVTTEGRLTHDEDERRDLGDAVGLGSSNGNEVTTGSEKGEVISQRHIGLV